MSEVLGEAVLDLTADLGPLARKLAEARTLTESSLDFLARKEDAFAARTIAMGRTLDRSFLDPLGRAYDHLALRTTGLITALDRLEVTARDTGRSLVELSRASTGSAIAISRATESIRRDSDRTAAAIAASSAVERKAIDAVTAAYLLQAGAARAAQQDRIAALRIGGEQFRLPFGRERPQLVPGGQVRELSIAGAKASRGGGSPANPVVTVIEASQYANLGSRAAAIAFSNLMPKAQNQIAQQLQQALGTQPLGEISSTVSLDKLQYAGILNAIVTSHAEDALLLREIASRALPRSTSRDYSMYGAPGSREPVGMLPRSTSNQWIIYQGGGGGGRGAPPVLQAGGDQPLLLELTKIAGLLTSAAQTHRTVIPAPFSMASTRGMKALPSGGTQGERFVVTDPTQVRAAQEMYQDYLDLKALQAEIERSPVVAAVGGGGGGPAGRAGGPGGAGGAGGGAGFRPRPTTRILSPEERSFIYGGAGRSRDANKKLEDLTRQELNILARGRGVGAPESLATKADVAAAIAAVGDRGVPRSPVAGAGEGGGGGGGRDILARLLFGRGGGGFGRGGFGRGGFGRFGLGLFGAGAGAGSALSFAGLDPMHAVLTALGVAGSAATAVGGAGALALGSVGQLAVGGGSDVAVLKSTIADTQTLSKDMTALASAQQTYGKSSQQASTAAKQLNADIAGLGNTAGVKAELQLAKQTNALNAFWDQQTSAARVAAVHILEQVVRLGHDFVPKVAKAALMNLTIINRDIKPLFAWLEGPTGMGIFDNLERNFKRNLPTAIDAFTNATEALLRITSLASNYTGGFMRVLDKLAIRLNSMSNTQLNDVIQRLIGDFRVWERFIKAIGLDLYYLFRQDAGTGQSIITTLTGMLDKLGQWEKSTRGASQIHSIFEVHKQEVLALLQLMPPLLETFGRFYLTVAPPLTQAFTGILTVVVNLLDALSKLGPVMDNLLALTLIGAKLGVLKPILTGVAGSLGLVAKNEVAAAAGADAMAAAAPRLGGAAAIDAAAVDAQAATSGRLGRFGLGAMGTSLAGRASAIPGVSAETAKGLAPLASRAIAGAGIAGIGTLIATSIGSSIHGAVGKAVSDIGSGAAIGGGLGSIFGPWGTAAGAALGAGLGGALDLFTTHAKSDGEKWAERFTSTLPGKLDAATSRAFTRVATATPPMRPSALDQGGQGPRELVLGEHLNTALFDREFNAEFNKIFNWARQFGLKSGDAWVKGMQSVKFPTEFLIERDIRQRLAQIPPAVARDGAEATRAWRNAAASQMLTYAQTLVDKGKLPRDAVSRMIASLESQFPGLATYLRQAGLNNEKAVADNSHFKQAQSNLKTALGNFRSQWDDTALSVKETNHNIYRNTNQAMMDLGHMLKVTSGKAHAEVKAEWEALRTDSVHEFTLMGAQLTEKAQAMTASIRSNTGNARQIAETNFAKFADAVHNAMQSGAISTQLGTELIAKATNATLKALGIKQIPITTIDPHLPKTVLQKSIGGAAGGGVFQVGQPGAAGHDTVPMNVGGQNIMVGEGEQVVVFNRHQIPEAEARFADTGGLAGFFATRTRPNFMAQGGVVGNRKGFATGGYVDPIGGWNISRVDQGVDASAPVGTPVLSIGDSTVVDIVQGWYAGQPLMMLRLNSGPDAGRLWYVAEQITPAGGVGSHFKAGQAVAHFAPSGSSIEIGWGSLQSPHYTLATAPGHGGYTEGQATPEGSSFLNFIRGLAHGKLLPGGGGVGGVGGISIPTITAPHVKGRGTVPDMVRGALGLEVKDINKFLQKHAGAAGGFPSVGPLSGPVERQIAEAASRLGWNKIGIAGLIGNSVQESSLNPSLNVPAGRGLFSWDPTTNPAQAAKVVIGNVGEQISLVAQTIGRAGIRAMNNAGSPGAAALWFEKNFERADPRYANNPRREAAAQQAFAAGYASGGIPRAARGGMFAKGGITKKGSPSDERAFGRMLHSGWGKLLRARVLPAWAHYPGYKVVQHGFYGGSRPYTPYGTHREPVFPESFIPHALDYRDPLDSWAREAIVHEWAHTMQGPLSAAWPTWEREGGAQAWADEHFQQAYKARSWAGDFNYAGYVHKVLDRKGWDWVNRGQFSRHAQGGMLPRRFASGGYFAGAQPGSIVGGVHIPRGTQNKHLVPPHQNQLQAHHYYPGWNPTSNEYEWHTRHQWDLIWNYKRAQEHGKHPARTTPRARHQKKQTPPRPTKVTPERPSRGHELHKPSVWDKKFINLFSGDNIGAAYLSQLLGNDGPIARTTDLLSYWEGIWGLNSTVSGVMSGGPSSAIVQDPVTGAITLDQTSVNRAISELSQQVAWQSAIVQDYQIALNVSGHLIPQVHKTLAVAQAKLAAVKRYDKKFIPALKKEIRDLGTHKRNRARRHELQKQLVAYQNDPDAKGLQKTIAGLQNMLTTVSAYPDTIGGAGGTGLGGEIGPAKLDLMQSQQELAALSPAAVRMALATSKAGAGGAGAGATATDNSAEIISLLEQQAQTANTALFVSQQQYKVLASLPPYGGSFAGGGTVPGPLGEPRTIVAHGGERISNREDGGPIQIYINGDLAALVDTVECVVDGKKQDISNYVNHDVSTDARARRLLPGRTTQLRIG